MKVFCFFFSKKKTFLPSSLPPVPRPNLIALPMIVLLLGAATLLVLMAALGMFSRAQVGSIKQFGVWVLAFAGLSMAAMLFLTRGPIAAIAVLATVGPLVWSWMPRSKRPAGLRTPNTSRSGAMTRAEAYEILGLPQGASEVDIRAAHLRLMQAAHPDLGGSDWLASRINQARDTLLG